MDLMHGDKFESENIDWLHSKLPYYEKIWVDYIGHDGQGNPIPPENLDEIEIINWKKFCQAHYSFAISLHLLDKIELTDNYDLLTDINTVMTIMMYVGHVRDMFKIMDGCLKACGKLSQPFQELYDKRSHIIHGPRIPIKYDSDGLMMVPHIAGRNEGINEWHSNQTWDIAKKGEFDYLIDILEETKAELFTLINRIHPSIYGYAERLFRSKINWRKYLAIGDIVITSPAASGTCY